jgi:FKBP-type peptidyl-prolyl cis-trans isomerase FkpA
MKKIAFQLIMASGLLLSLSGCMKNESKVEQRCEYDACAFKAPAAEVQKVRDYLAANNITDTVEHCSGLIYTIVSEGTGKTPEYCSNVYARYKGMLTDSSVFDQSGEQPIGFNLQGVIPGWTNALPKIKEGGKMILYIPPSLGYGTQEIRDRQTGALKIPANSILVFEVELVSIP